MNYLNSIKELIENNIVLKNKHKLVEENNTLITYFEIGKLLVKAKGGKERAKYGDGLIKKWSIELTKLYGKGYDISNLKRMKIIFNISKRSCSAPPIKLDKLIYYSSY